MKILYSGVCKLLPNRNKYDELVGQIELQLNLPQGNVGEYLKLFYLDKDGDTICISCDFDLQMAMEIYPDGRFKMALSKSTDDATAVLSRALNQSSKLEEAK